MPVISRALQSLAPKIIFSITLIISVSATILFASNGKAYSEADNRGLLPIGEVESFMANTGTALSGSTGAVYFNPAGLASIVRNHVSVSANSYLSTRATVDPIQTIDGTDMSFTSKGLQAIPSAFVSTGRRDRWSYAFSVLIPHALRIQDAVSYTTPSYPALQFSRTNFFQLLMAGLSVATTNENYDVGLGCFYTMYQTTQTSTLNGKTVSGANSLVINSYFDAQVSGFMCNAGLQQQASELLRWGFAVRMPLVATSKSGTASMFVQNPNTGIATAIGPKPIDAEYRLPLDFTLGFEYRLSPLTTAFLDLSYQLDTSYSSGDIGSDPTSNKATPRASSGLRYRPWSDFELYAGFGYNPSSVNPNASDYTENYLIATTGGRWSSGNSNIGVGAIYATGTGEKDAPIYNAALTQTGKKSSAIATQAFGVMVSSGYTF